MADDDGSIDSDSVSTGTDVSAASAVSSAKAQGTLAITSAKAAVTAGATAAGVAACAATGVGAGVAYFCGLAAGAAAKWVEGHIGPILQKIGSLFKSHPKLYYEVPSVRERLIFDALWYRKLQEDALLDVYGALANLYLQYALPGADRVLTLSKTEPGQANTLLASIYDPIPYLIFWGNSVGGWTTATSIRPATSSAVDDFYYWSADPAYPNGYRDTATPGAKSTDPNEQLKWRETENAYELSPLLGGGVPYHFVPIDQTDASLALVSKQEVAWVNAIYLAMQLEHVRLASLAASASVVSAITGGPVSTSAVNRAPSALGAALARSNKVRISGDVQNSIQFLRHHDAPVRSVAAASVRIAAPAGLLAAVPLLFL